MTIPRYFRFTWCVFFANENKDLRSIIFCFPLSWFCQLFRFSFRLISQQWLQGAVALSAILSLLLLSPTPHWHANEQLDSTGKRGQSPIGSQKMHTDDSAQRFYRSAIWSRMFPNGSFFVVLRSCRLILVHCSFSASIAKQIYLPIQFLLVINLGCFHIEVLCNMSFSPLHCLLS